MQPLTQTSAPANHLAPLTASPRTLSEAAPAVSVIVPAYNVASYIADSLDSVFAQTFTGHEVILVNDGSPDTEEFERAIQPYLDRIIYLKQENGGASVARNRGLQAARGEFVAFLDGDDIWLPNYLEEQMNFIQKRGCDLACADALMFGESRTEGRRYMDLLMDSAPSVADVSFLELVDAKRCLITSGVIARRQPILDIGLFDTALRRGQDFDLWLRLSLAGRRLSYHRNALLKYRCRTDGLTGDQINSHRRELTIFDKIEQRYDVPDAVRAEVRNVIKNRRALLQFEIGKLYAAGGEYTQSAEAFKTANRLQPSLKTFLAVWLIRLTPGFMKLICLSRTEQI